MADPTYPKEKNTNNKEKTAVVVVIEPISPTETITSDGKTSETTNTSESSKKTTTSTESDSNQTDKSDESAVKDPNFWHRFSIAVHRDEELARLPPSEQHVS